MELREGGVGEGEWGAVSWMGGRVRGRGGAIEGGARGGLGWAGVFTALDGTTGTGTTRTHQQRWGTLALANQGEVLLLLSAGTRFSSRLQSTF